MAPFLRVAGLVILVCLVARYAAKADPSRCIGDCDFSQRVTVEEMVLGVDIALGRAAVSRCAVFDANGDRKVGVNELIAAVRNSLHGCPAATATPSPSSSATSTDTAPPTDTPAALPTDTATPTSTVPTATATATGTDSPTATATVNRPPLRPTALIYRTYPGFDVRLPIGAADPEGGPVLCMADGLPAGASFDAPSGTLSWTPTGEQLGPFYVPWSCTDDAVPPLSASGQLTLKVAPLDDCVIPSCDPASGCTATLPPVDQPCCAAGPAARVAEPAAGCPEGRVLYVGQSVDSFGRLQNCDTMQVVNFDQSGAEVRFHVEARCVNTTDRVRMHARMESNAPTHPLLFDVEGRQFFLSEPGPNGFARQRNLRFPVDGGGPFFDLQDAAATLTLTLTDADGAAVSHQVRLRLSFMPLIDLPDVDPAP